MCLFVLLSRSDSVSLLLCVSFGIVSPMSNQSISAHTHAQNKPNTATTRWPSRCPSQTSKQQGHHEEEEEEEEEATQTQTHTHPSQHHDGFAKR